MTNRKKQKRKFYVLIHDSDTDIFTTWDECREAIKGQKHVKHKAFTDRADAEAFIKKHQRDSTAQTEAETNHMEKEPTTDVEEMVESEKKYCTPTCKYDGGDEEGDKMINCDICEGWYHLSCVELNEKEALELSFWVCKSCKDSHLMVKSLKADLEALKMKLQTVEHSLTSDIDILRKELAILKNAREADMTTMMSKEKAGNPGKTHPNQKPDERTENPSASTDRKSIKKGNTNTIEIVEQQETLLIKAQ